MILALNGSQIVSVTEYTEVTKEELLADIEAAEKMLAYRKQVLAEYEELSAKISTQEEPTREEPAPEPEPQQEPAVPQQPEVPQPVAENQNVAPQPEQLPPAPIM